MWDLRRQPAQLFQRQMDLLVRLDALRLIQLHRRARQSAIGSTCYRYHHFKISR